MPTVQAKHNIGNFPSIEGGKNKMRLSFKLYEAPQRGDTRLVCVLCGTV